MKAGQLLFTFGLLVITSGQLPAPITEESTPAGVATTKPRPGESPATETLPELEGYSAPRFDGTWQISGVNTTSAGSNRWTATLVIENGRKAQWSRETTSILEHGKTWPRTWLPAPYNNISPIFERWVDESTDLKIEGAKLTIRWPRDQLADWSPKTIPARLFEKTKGGTNTVTYLLKGDQLVSTDGEITATWHRIR